MSATTKFQLALSVSDLPRSIAFYRLLLNCAPTSVTAQTARFETDQPPFMLALSKGEAGKPEKTLNHLGFRMPTQVVLVDLQRRLEEAGISTQRQDGVECCYALQTKFWVTDPDKHLWELYIFHQDLDRSGFDDAAALHPWKPKSATVWHLPLTDPIPARLDYADGELDEAHLDGTFNGLLDEAVKTNLLAELFRVLAPGGTVAVHCMVGDRPFPGVPAFPGIAALVKYVPTPAELTGLLRQAGFVNVFFATFNEICLSVPGMELREILLQATRPENAGLPEPRHVLYRGPFDEITDDDGVTYRRGERVGVSAASWLNLHTQVADQFVFFPS